MKKSFFALLLLLLLLVTGGCREKEPVDPPTPAEPQSVDGYRGQTGFSDGMPIVSPAPGVYGGETTVTAASAQGHTVRYTADCTEPTASSPAFPGKGITLSPEADADENGGVTVKVFRLAAFDAGGNKVGDTVTATYILSEDPDRFSTGIVSLVCEPDDLYSYERGILVEGEQADLYQENKSVISANYNGKGREWERPASFSFFTEDGKIGFSQNVGVRLNGTGSRKEAQKNFRIFARKEYCAESGKLKYAFFPGQVSGVTGEKVEKFDTLLLRGCASNVGNTLITNSAVLEMAQACDALTTSRVRPVAAFVNGEYYGLMMLTEDYSPEYFASYYGVDPDTVTTTNMTVVQNTENPYLGWEHDDGSEEDFREFERALVFLRYADYTNERNYERAQEYLDLDNFIQYITVECYLNNWDWPRNNIRVWRANVNGYDPDAAPGFDGRWRFVLKDLDITMNTLVNIDLGYESDIGTDFFAVLEKDSGAPQLIDGIFRHLLENADFRERVNEYVRYFVNTVGEPGNLLESLTRFTVTVSKEVGYHLAEYDVYYSESAYDWDVHIERMRAFADQRQALVLPQIEDRTGVDYTSIAIEPYEGGTVYFEGIPLRRLGTGFVTEPGSTIPFTAVPDPGWEFVELQVNPQLKVRGSEVKVVEKRGTVIPVFRKVGEESSPAPETPTGYVLTPSEKVCHGILADGVLYEGDSFERNAAGEILLSKEEIVTMLGDHDGITRMLARRTHLFANGKITVSEFIKAFTGAGRVIYEPTTDTYVFSCAGD